MAVIRNERYAGLKHVIGSFFVEFKEDATAIVPKEVAESVNGIPGFTVVDFADPIVEPKSEPNPESEVKSTVADHVEDKKTPHKAAAKGR